MLASQPLSSALHTGLLRLPSHQLASLRALAAGGRRGAAAMLAAEGGAATAAASSDALSPSSSRPKVLLLTGPTAVGKTRASLALAEALNGEVISADSVQVYRGLDVGSDKVRWCWVTSGAARLCRVCWHASWAVGQACLAAQL